MKEKKWKKEMEKGIYENWKAKKAYRFRKGKKIFSIDTPPPYVNTPVHIGHATTYTLMDMFARFRRMTGYSVVFPLGLDRNGLPIEVAAEKKFKIRFTDTPREKFIEYCKKLLEESSSESVDSFLKLGISFSSWKVGSGIGDAYHTDSPEYRALTQSTFIDLWKKGLVYEDERINNYCPGCRTTIADAEIDYDEIDSVFNDISFKVKETDERITIGTTRPELLCTCAMIIFNPEDERYRYLEGKTAVTPLFNREIPIRSHPYADREKGTGLMMMCSMGDQTDIRFFREMKLEPVIAIGTDGKMNKNAGFLEGLHVKKAREKIIEELKKHDLLVKQRKIKHRTPVCERSKDPVEFISMKEFYVKQVEFRKEMKKIADELRFFSPASRQILVDWIESVSIDWPVSRRRYYATEIPLWYCKCGEVILAEKGKYVQPWKDGPGKKCSKCGSGEIRGEERVFDTWFDSSSSPLYVIKDGKSLPCSLRPQGKEIVRTWLYYTLLKSSLLYDRHVFEDVWIHHHVTDDKGKKMSKSVGNVIDPHKILERFGAEPFRLWCAVEGSITDGDLKCSFERIEGAGKTLTKLWNVSRFVSSFPHVSKATPAPLDVWIINEMNSLIEYSRKRYEKYDFHKPAIRIRHFLWETFASHYLELVKSRAYNQDSRFAKSEQNAALFTLHHCLDNMLKLLAPVTPFITEKVYAEVHKKDIHSQDFPEIFSVKEITDFSTEDLVQLNSAVWKHKRDSGLSLKSELAEATVPEKFRSIEKDLTATHGIKKINYGELKLV